MIGMYGISRWYSSTGILALDSIDLEIQRGTIHAIVGENGAGKSTLVRIASGLLAPSSGEIEIDGRKLPIGRVDSALKLGVGLVSQYPALVEGYSLLEDAILGIEPLWGPFLSRKKAKERWKGLVCELGLNLDGDKPVSGASAAERQMARLVGLLFRDLKYLLLDEVSAVLNDNEREALYALMRRLSSMGLGLVMLSHRLEEVLLMADRVSVLRAGRLVGDAPAASLDTERLNSLIFSPPLETQAPNTGPFKHKTQKSAANADRTEGKQPQGTPFEGKSGRPLPLRIKGLEAAPPGWPPIRGIDLVIEAGSICGLGGIREAGIETLEQLIGGSLASSAGTLEIAGISMERETALGHSHAERSSAASVGRARDAGLAWIAGSRGLNMLPERMPLGEALAACSPRRYALNRAPFLLDRRKIASAAAALIEEARIKAQPDQACGTLSGGSQRRFAIERELARPSALLLAMEPFWGLDRTSVERLHKRFKTYTAQGGAILMISVDSEALIALCDRLLVLYDGRLASDIRLDSQESRAAARSYLPALLTGKTYCQEEGA